LSVMNMSHRIPTLISPVRAPRMNNGARFPPDEKTAKRPEEEQAEYRHEESERRFVLIVGKLEDEIVENERDGWCEDGEKYASREHRLERRHR
jgi:hypothetical protein